MANTTKYLDPTIKELLQPLVNMQAVIHYPHFANCFPLVYYYTRFLKLEYGPHIISSLIREREWNDSKIDVASLNSHPCHIFFNTATKAKIHKVEGYTTDQFHFTEYFPRFIFSEYSTRIINYLQKYKHLKQGFDRRRDFGNRRIIESNGPIRFFTDCLSRELFDSCNIKKVLLFTDTETQAHVIKKEILSQFDREVFVVVDSGSSDEKYDLTTILQEYPFNSHEILKLYFFSAPYNMYFLKEVHKYIPFQLKQNQVKHDFVTCNYILHKKEKGDKEIEKVGKNLEEFHRIIFSEAKHYPQNLSNVYHAYNEVSRLKEPIKVMDDVHEYSFCLLAHSNDNHDLEREDNNWSRLLSLNDDESEYAASMKELSGRIRNIYSLLMVHYLLIDLGFDIKVPLKRDIVKILLAGGKWLEGRYFLYLRDYIKSEIAHIITHYVGLSTSNAVKMATNAKVTEDAIFHSLLFEKQRDVIKVGYDGFYPEDILSMDDEQKKFLIAERLVALDKIISDTMTIINPKNIKYSNKMILEMFGAVGKRCKSVVGRKDTIFGNKLLDEDVCAALKKIDKPSGN